MSDSESMASRRRSWLTMASARKSSISLPRKMMRSRRRRPMTSPLATPPGPSDSARIPWPSHRDRGDKEAADAETAWLRRLSLRRGWDCAGTRALEQSCRCLRRRAAVAESEAVALALAAAIAI
jgi:hypothetical protein